MSVMALAAYGLLVVVGLALSALYSGLETGIYTINRVRLVVLANRGQRTARRLQLETGSPNRLLATLLVGNNVANYMGIYGVAAILDGLGFTPGQAIAINAGLLVPLLFVFGETLPKDLFRTHTDHWTYRLSGSLVLSRWLFTACGLLPVVRGTGALAGRLLRTAPHAAASARQHISQLIKEGVGAGVLSEGQATLADRALALRDRTVRAEMVPWKKACWLPLSAGPEHRREQLERHNFTRLPVVDESGKVVGVLAMLDVLLEPDRSTAQLMRPAVTFSPNTSVGEALKAMRTGRQAMAIVTEGSTNEPLGLLTLKDLVEPLTGELAAW